MSDWRKQLREYLDKQEPREYSQDDRDVPGMFYADRAFEPSPEEITQFLKEIGHDSNHSR